MIMMSELLQNKEVKDLSQPIKLNLLQLHTNINQIRAAYGKPMTVTSCIRTIADQLRIYKAKGITDQTKIPMKSKHLYAQAVDIADPDGELYKWAKANPKALEEANMWCEEGTKGWVHFQCVPFNSWEIGKSRWFLP